MGRVLTVLVAFLVFFSVSFGKKAPDVVFEDLDGNKVKVSSFKGKPTVLVFWQPHCWACKKDLPAVSKIAEKFKGKVRFYAVVIGTRDILAIEEAKIRWGFDLPVLIADYRGKSAFGIFGTPITVVLDKDLNIVVKIIGSGKEKKLEKILHKLVNSE